MDPKHENPYAFGSVEDNQAFEQLGIQRSSGWEAFKASYELSLESTPLEAIGRISELQSTQVMDEQQGLSPLSPEELNAKYPDLETPFREPTLPSVAQIIAQRQRDRRKLAEIASQGPSGGLYATGNFFAGMIPHAIDPLNIGAGIAISLSTGGLGTPAVVGRALGAVKGAEKAAKVLKAGSLVRNTAEGLAGAALVEPISAIAAHQDGMEYTEADFFENIVYGGVGGASAIWGIGRAVDAVRFAVPRSARWIRNRGRNFSETTQKSATAQLADDRLPNVEPIVEAAQAEIHGEVPGAPYEYRPLEAQSREVPNTPNPESAPRAYSSIMYTATTIDSLEATPVLGQDYGTGIYLTDKPGEANGVATSSFADRPGNVAEVNLENANLVDLNQALPDDVKNLITIFARANGLEVDVNLSGKEVINRVMDELEVGGHGEAKINEFNESLKAQGYDGYLDDGRITPEDPQRNVVMLFGDEKTKINRIMAGNSELVPKPSREKAKEVFEKSHSPESHIDYDPEAKSELEKYLDQGFEEPDFKIAEAKDAELLEELDRVEKLGMLDEDQKAQLEILRQAAGDAKKIDEITKSAAACLIRGGIIG